MNSPTASAVVVSLPTRTRALAQAPSQEAPHRLPHAGPFDSTLALLADPYGYLSRCARAVGSDVFETRLLLAPTICMTGPAAAELFYDARRFQRAGAAPELLRATLFGEGGVQTLDGAAHLRRKALFMEVLDDARVTALGERASQVWRQAASRWSPGDHIALYSTSQRVLTRAVCDWAGVPVAPGELARRTRQLTSLFDDAGRGLVAHLRSRWNRHRAQRWIGGLIEQVRAGALVPGPQTALHAVAWHRDADGQQLPPRTAAVELLNVLRPTVAVSVFIVFAAHALYLHPQWRGMLQRGEPGAMEAFVREVRRHYPFFPAVMARVREDFTWRGLQFTAGRRAVLDLYGTNHDRRAWAAPHEFRPERFMNSAEAASPGLYDFVPQGGGLAATGHRCPGEGVAEALMRASLGFLIDDDYACEIDDADLFIDTTRLPALPRGGLVLQVAGRPRAGPLH